MHSAIGQTFRLRNSTHGESAPRARRRVPSFPPCLIRAVDGIFRVEAAGGIFKTTDFKKASDFRAVCENLPVSKNWPRAMARRARESGRGKFDWPMSSFSKPTD